MYIVVFTTQYANSLILLTKLKNKFITIWVYSYVLLVMFSKLFSRVYACYCTVHIKTEQKVIIIKKKMYQQPQTNNSPHRLISAIFILNNNTQKNNHHCWPNIFCLYYLLLNIPNFFKLYFVHIYFTLNYFS